MRAVRPVDNDLPVSGSQVSRTGTRRAVAAGARAFDPVLQNDLPLLSAWSSADPAKGGPRGDPRGSSFGATGRFHRRPRQPPAGCGRRLPGFQRQYGCRWGTGPISEGGERVLGASAGTISGLQPRVARSCARSCIARAYCYCAAENVRSRSHPLRHQRMRNVSLVVAADGFFPIIQRLCDKGCSPASPSRAPEVFSRGPYSPNLLTTPISSVDV